MSVIEPLLSVDEAAATLGVHRNTVRLLIQRGVLVHVAVGRRTMVAPNDLRDYIATHRTRRNDDGPVATEPFVKASTDAGGGDDSA